MQVPVTSPGPGGLESLLSAIKPVVPIPILLVVLPALWWFFRSTWKDLDDEATAWRVRAAAEGLEIEL